MSSMSLHFYMKNGNLEQIETFSDYCYTWSCYDTLHWDLYGPKYMCIRTTYFSQRARDFSQRARDLSQGARDFHCLQPLIQGLHPWRTPFSHCQQTEPPTSAKEPLTRNKIINMPIFLYVAYLKLLFWPLDLLVLDLWIQFFWTTGATCFGSLESLILDH